MRRTFNFTGRKTIPSGLVSVTVKPGGADGVRSFDMRLGDLSTLGLPSSARIYVEPYVKASSMRFPFGTVGSVLPPSDRSLTEIDDGATVLFRILVVDESDKVGRLLAMADKVAPHGDDQQRESVLPLVTEDLGEAVWRLEASEGTQPRLLINSRFPGLKQRLIEDPLMMGAILPIAVRDALRAARQADDPDAEWVGRWRRYVADVAGQETAERIFDDGPEEGPELDEAIERVCEILIERRRYVSRALERELGAARHA
ncbi:MAG: hypothetical protein NZM07_05075 [Elioraea sp.]|nr:hypothetical protein [Elioraea sp.]